MIGEEQLLEWERLANEATEGPWKNDVRVGSSAIYPSKYDVHCFGDDTHIICMFKGKYYNDQWNMADQQIADGDFIAASREAVPALIAEVRAQRNGLKNRWTHLEYAQNARVNLVEQIRQLEKEIVERDAKIAKLNSVIKQACSFCCGWLEMKCGVGDKCPIYKLKVEKEAQND